MITIRIDKRNLSHSRFNKLEGVAHHLLAAVGFQAVIQPEDEVTVGLTLDQFTRHGYSRDQVYRALRKLQKQGWLTYEASRGRDSEYQVQVQWMGMGMRVEHVPDPVEVESRPKSRPKSRPRQQPPVSISSIPLPPRAVAPPPSGSSTPSPVPEPHSSVPLPFERPEVRANVSVSRINELCRKPPSSWAELLDEVQPEWQIQVRPDVQHNISLLEQSYPPSKLNAYALGQLLKKTTNNPALYLMRLFRWDGPSPAIADHNHLNNVKPGDPTGRVEAQRKYEEQRRRQEESLQRAQEETKERKLTQEETEHMFDIMCGRKKGTIDFHAINAKLNGDQRANG